MAELMNLSTWIERNRDDIDSVIKDAVKKGNLNIDDDERKIWVLNDEGLYNSAIADGVDI